MPDVGQQLADLQASCNALAEEVASIEQYIRGGEAELATRTAAVGPAQLMVGCSSFSAMEAALPTEMRGTDTWKGIVQALRTTMASVAAAAQELVERDRPNTPHQPTDDTSQNRTQPTIEPDTNI